MSLTDDIESSRRRQGGTCTVPALVDAVGADRDDLLAALASDTPSTAIARALRGRGHYIGSTTLNRHRRGDCRCRS